MGSKDMHTPIEPIGIGSKEGEPLLGDEVSQRYPPGVAFIIGQELVERFAFYGLRAILYVFFLNHMLFNDADATAIVHTFIMLSYGFSLIGAYASDTLLGKYHTIFYVSFFYILGAALLALSAVDNITGTPPHWWMSVIGLVLIALGTGGLKPCISTFVGDQFGPGQEHMLENVFFVFYFCGNVGGLLSTVITPEIMKISFVWAFGIPALLLAASILIFTVGRKNYVVKSPTGNPYAEVWRAVRIGCREARRHGLTRPSLSWLDYARDECGYQSVNGVKSFLRVAKVLLPISVFWSLYDQTTTRWISQTQGMDLVVFGYLLEASQVPAMTPIIILIAVPTFNRIIYPGARKYGLLPSALARVGIGMTMAAVAFALAAILQMAIEAQPPNSISVGWQVPQYVILESGQVMVSVTGLDFAYQQAPNSMKAVIMALFLCTVALGNLLVVVVALIQPPGGLAVEFWIFSGLMLVFCGFFSCLARNFPYELHLAVANSKDDES
jgi:POT family proton-dependent oligopeptide transporter